MTALHGCDLRPAEQKRLRPLAPCKTCGGPKPRGRGHRSCAACLGAAQRQRRAASRAATAARRAAHVSAPRLSPHGYYEVYASKHPVAAASNGTAQLHRLLLFNAIGPGSHPCHHCSKPVAWEDEFPGGLVVDHLDANRINNDLVNLAPSCHPCNARRTSKTREAVSA